jgi:signal transduction histidine kinase
MSIKTRLIFAVSLLVGLMVSQLYLSIIIAETKALMLFSIFIASLAVFILWVNIINYLTTGIKALQQTISQATEGNLSQIYPGNTQDEFSRLAHSINVMLTSLDFTRQENNQLHEEALQMKEEKIALLKNHLSQVVKVQEDERKRVSRELHDQAGQALMAIQLGLGRIEKHTCPNDEINKEIAELKILTHSTMQDIKNLALDLRPSMLDELGLIPTIRQYAKEFSRRTGIQIKLELAIIDNNQHNLNNFTAELETTLFRIIQEALTNVAKHAEADMVMIQLKETDSKLELIINDNGAGFDVTKALANQKKKCVGLFGMKERVSLWSGNLVIKSSPGEGTTLFITIPAGTMVS